MYEKTLNDFVSRREISNPDARLMVSAIGGHVWCGKAEATPELNPRLRRLNYKTRHTSPVSRVAKE